MVLLYLLDVALLAKVANYLGISKDLANFSLAAC